MSLTETLYRVPRTWGLEALQLRGQGARELSSWRLRLQPGTSARFVRQDEEAIFVLQEGEGVLNAGGERFSVSRPGVFASPATALYLPPGCELEVHAETVLEALLIATPTDAGGTENPVLIPPEAVRVVDRGMGNYGRQVHDILVSDAFSSRLLVGETFNPPGHWSSFPPHKHDGRDGEPRLEEVYHYRVDPPQGFGQQLLYTTEGESVAHTVFDGDAVLLPYGYHPVAAPPGYRLYYLWALAGDERRLSLHEDPQHRWIHQLSD